MTTQSELPLDETIENTEETTYTEYGAEQTPPTESIETPTEQVTEAPVEEAPVSFTPTPEPVDQEKLLQERQEMLARQEREQTIRELEQEALAMDRQLRDQGYSESEAQTQTKSHLENRVKQIELEHNMKQQVQIEQGKRNASIHYAKKYNLGIDSLLDLEKAQTPQEMDSIAKSMSRLAKLEQENAELKSRLAPQQSFDSNAPTPAAATNEERLLDAYLAGDRSEAATKAARKLLG